MRACALLGLPSYRSLCLFDEEGGLAFYSSNFLFGISASWTQYFV